MRESNSEQRTEPNSERSSEPSLSHSLPSRAPADQGSGNRELGNGDQGNFSNSPSIPTTSTSTRDAQTVDGRAILEQLETQVDLDTDQSAYWQDRIRRGTHHPDEIKAWLASLADFGWNPSSNPEPGQPSTESTGRASDHARWVHKALKIEQLDDGSYRMTHLGSPTLMEIIALAEFAQMMAKYEFSAGLRSEASDA